MRLVEQLNPEVYLQAEMDGVDSGYFVSPAFSKQTYLSKLTDLPMPMSFSSIPAPFATMQNNGSESD
jgi:hypothetical protein